MLKIDCLFKISNAVNFFAPAEKGYNSIIKTNIC